MIIKIIDITSEILLYYTMSERVIAEKLEVITQGVLMHLGTRKPHNKKLFNFIIKWKNYVSLLELLKLENELRVDP